MVKTNYDLCQYICDFIKKTVVDKEEYTRDKNTYFALYIFTLYKIFNVSHVYCKEIITIYCNEFLSYAFKDYTPEDVYDSIIDKLAAFDRDFETNLRRYKKADASYINEALSTIMDTLCRLLESGPVYRESAGAALVRFISEAAAILEGLGLQ